MLCTVLYVQLCTYVVMYSIQFCDSNSNNGFWQLLWPPPKRRQQQNILSGFVWRWWKGEDGQKIERSKWISKEEPMRNFGWNCINFQSESKPKRNDQNTNEWSKKWSKYTSPRKPVHVCLAHSIPSLKQHLLRHAFCAFSQICCLGMCVSASTWTELEPKPRFYFIHFL